VEDLPEIYHLESIEQVRALADELRLRIVDLLLGQALTVTQLGKLLGVAPARVHYHVRELERVGLLRLVETREKGGILEKYYRAVARHVAVPPALLRGASPDESIAAIEHLLQSVSATFVQAFAHALRAPETPRTPLALTTTPLWLAPQEHEQLVARIQALLEPYTLPRNVPDERPCNLVQILYAPPAPTGDVATVVAPSPPAPPRSPRQDFGGVAGASKAATPSPLAAGHRKKGYRLTIADLPGGAADPATAAAGHQQKSYTFAAGAITYARQDLENIVARGQALESFTLGFCSFAADIPAELVDRAFARFRHRGKLRASPEVREVLKRKEV
jgi:DNA-binding transcriptional ArsR family regulator